jgi:hypothetical protein
MLLQIIGCIGRVVQVFANGNLTVQFEKSRKPLTISSAAVSPVVISLAFFCNDFVVPACNLGNF